MELIPVTEQEQLAGIQQVLERAPEYALRVTGHPTGPADAQSLYSALPEGVTYAQKYVWAIGDFGVADVIRGWPNPQSAMLRLLLLAEDATGRGLGRVAYEALESKIRAWPEIAQIRLGVVDTNAQVTGFWERMGFVATGEAKTYRYDKVQSIVQILVKGLSTGLSPAGD